MFCGDIPSTGLYAPNLCHMSVFDQDFTWMVDMFYKLGTQHSEVVMFDEDTEAMLSCLSPEVFTVGMFAIQHVCARLESTNAFLINTITNGVYKLYEHYLKNVKQGETMAIGALQEFGEISSVEVCSFDEAFTGLERGVRESCRNYYLKKGTPVPALIVKVPWQQALSLVGSRKPVYIDNGMAFLDHGMLGEWMRERWKSGMREWKEWDAVNIIMPINNRAMPALISNLPVSSDSSSYNRLLGEAERKSIQVPLLERLNTDLFVPFDMFQSMDPQDPSLQALIMIYKIIFKALRCFSSTSSSSAPEVTPIEEGVTCEEIMPPCVAKIYNDAFDARTHLVYRQRLKFFTWGHKAGVPLDMISAMWSRMLDNETSPISSGERASLMSIPKQIYYSEDAKAANGTLFNYNSCKTMVEYCPVGDIEDLALRKRSCIKTCTGKEDTIEVVDLTRKWSPLFATSQLKLRANEGT